MILLSVIRENKSEMFNLTKDFYCAKNKIKLLKGFTVYVFKVKGNLLCFNNRGNEIQIPVNCTDYFCKN